MSLIDFPLLLIVSGLGLSSAWFNSGFKYSFIPIFKRDLKTMEQVDLWLDHGDPDWLTELLCCPNCFGFHCGFWLSLFFNWQVGLSILVGLSVSFLSALFIKN